MAQIENLPLVLTGLGLTASILYYTMTLRNANKTQQQQLETRQAQLYMQLYQQLNNRETIQGFLELLKMEWRDYSDFINKYGGENNPESYALCHSIWYLLDGLGYLLKENLVTPKMMYKLIGLEVPWHWKKYSGIIAEMRIEAKLVNMYEDFEYLAETMSKIQLEIDPSWEMPKGFIKSVPSDLVTP